MGWAVNLISHAAWGEAVILSISKMSSDTPPSLSKVRKQSTVFIGCIWGSYTRRFDLFNTAVCILNSDCCKLIFFYSMLLPPFKQSTKNLLETPCGFWFYILYGLPCALNSLEYFIAAMFECLTFIGCDAGLALKRLVLDNSLGFCPSFSCAPAWVEIDACTNVFLFCPRFIVCTSHGQ